MTKKTTHIVYENDNGEFYEFSSEKEALQQIADMITTGVFTLSDFIMFEIKHGYNLRVEVVGDKG